MKSAYLNQDCAVTETPSTDLDVVRNRLGEVLNFAQHMGERIDMMADKLVGVVPGPISVNANVPPRSVPNGLMAEMQMRLDDIMAVLQRTDGAVSKLRGII